MKNVEDIRVFTIEDSIGDEGKFGMREVKWGRIGDEDRGMRGEVV